MTVRLYLEDPYRQEFEAEVLESAGGWCGLSQTAFFAGGGTHVSSTDEIGRARIVRLDNKGKNNRRFYWELGD